MYDKRDKRVNYLFVCDCDYGFNQCLDLSILI